MQVVGILMKPKGMQEEMLATSMLELPMEMVHLLALE